MLLLLLLAAGGVAQSGDGDSDPGKTSTWIPEHPDSYEIFSSVMLVELIFYGPRDRENLCKSVISHFNPQA